MRKPLDTTIDPATLTDTALRAAGKRAALTSAYADYYGACQREIDYRNRVERETGKRPKRVTL